MLITIIKRKVIKRGGTHIELPNCGVGFGHDECGLYSAGLPVYRSYSYTYVYDGEHMRTPAAGEKEEVPICTLYVADRRCIVSAGT
jgi:hypothetical protein